MEKAYAKGKSPVGVTRGIPSGMWPHFEKIEALKDVGDVLAYMSNLCVELGVRRMSYHITPAYEDPTSRTTSITTHGFSEEWLELYRREDFRKCDPIPERVLQDGAMMTWADAMKTAPNTPEHQRYFEAMKAHGLVHGFGLTLFGPRGCDAYASFDFGKPVEEVDPDTLAKVRALAQFGHQRICWLSDKTVDKPHLSEREVEVLTWAGRGKTTQEIASILDLSPDTVKTYSKRIYAKLETSDRVGAVLKALQLGLVKV